jgi:hypothetical protein
MQKPIFLGDRVSGLSLPLRFTKGAQKRRRRANYRPNAVAECSRLEDRCMMSGTIPQRQIPPAQAMTSNVNALSDVLYVGTERLPAPPTRTITIYNTSDKTVYPMLEDANNREDTLKPMTSLYDPQDPYNNEYRGYIGYKTDGGVTVGLPAHTSITVDVPLVFWNANTIQFFTTPNILVNDNTFTYKGGSGSKRFIQDAVGKNVPGRIMWYHAPLPQNTGPDAPAQLMEFTIRDKNLTKWAPNVTKETKETLIDLFGYNVSYVQDMLLPITLEAANVPIGTTGDTATYGWNGANISVDAMSTGINMFTADAGAGNKQPLLGSYFDGKGWDEYYLPTPKVTGIKIPANDKLFGLSPLGDTRSTYDSGKFMLASGGNVFQESSPGSVTLHSDEITDLNADVVKQLKIGMLVRPNEPSPFDAGTTITGFGNDGKSITVSNKAKMPASTTFNFIGSTAPIGPIRDYVVSTLTSLWYAWANYYATTNSLPAIKYTSEVNPPTLKFTSDVDQANAFAKVVYTVMNAFSKVPPTPNNFVPATAQILQNIVGCNVGKLTNASPMEKTQLTNDVISLLRGVANFKVDTTWYPDPASATKHATVGGVAAKFNLYNLDPFVWFVHEDLKMSGYGFSVDDSSGFVGANGSKSLLISIGPTTDAIKMNPEPWSDVAPWGPVMSATGKTTAGTKELTNLNKKILNQITTGDPSAGVAGAIVSGPGIEPGTTVLGINFTDGSVSLSKKTTGGSGAYWFRGPNQTIPTTKKR